MFFVKILVLIPPCPASKFMKFYRQIHNIILSVLSFLMLVGITFGTYSAGKFKSLNDLVCLSYDNNLVAYTSAYIFLYSKYIEWGDTVFLHLSGKPITMLQYTHHMTTVFLVYIHNHEYMSPSYFIAMSLNCFVHVPMYWYFAFPTGFLYKFRKTITQIQIVQHILCLITTIYAFSIKNCEQNKYGTEFALVLYSMYLFFFSLFYIKSYLKKKLKLNHFKCQMD